MDQEGRSQASRYAQVLDKRRNLVLGHRLGQSQRGRHAGFLGDLAATASANGRADEIRSGQRRAEPLHQRLTYIARQIRAFEQPGPDFGLVAEPLGNPAQRNPRNGYVRIIQHVGNRFGFPDFRHRGRDRHGHRAPERHEALKR